MAERGGVWLWCGRLLAGAGVLAGIALLSNVPSGTDARQGLLRLAWRTVGEQVRLCRERSAEEQSRMLPHMRQAQDCSLRSLPYRLEVRVDGAARIAREVDSAGARSDRPLFVQEELALEPGPHSVQISFAAVTEAAQGGSGAPAVSEAQQVALREALARAHRYEGTLGVQGRPGRIVLVELDEARQGFRVSGD